MALEYNLKNKIIVITGGSQGIGKSMALEFARQNAKVIICARTQTDLDQTKKEIETLGGYCDTYVVDVSKQLDVENFFNNVVATNNKIDVLICSSGIYGPLGPLETNDMDNWKKTIEINLLGTVYCVHAALPHMKKEKSGSIITLCGGGVGSKNIKPNFSAYISSKAAIALFTEVIAKEVAEDNIQVNAISPGAVNTRLLDEVLNNADLVGADFIEASKKQRETGGTPPEKAAELAVWLACNKHVSGKTLSAPWDNYHAFDTMTDKLNASLYNLRRVDDFAFIEK